VPLPRSRWVRIGLGIVLMLGGMPPLGAILPFFGVGTIVLGLLVLSYDLPWVRRWRRRTEVVGLRWWRRHQNDAGISQMWRWTLAAASWPFLLIYKLKSWGRSLATRISWYRRTRRNGMRLNGFRRAKRKSTRTARRRAGSPAQ